MKKIARKSKPKRRVRRAMHISHEQHVEVTVSGPSAVTAFIDHDRTLHVYVWRGGRRPNEKQDTVLKYAGEAVPLGGETRKERS